jgi:D-glycero-D-manno-heptose 1,7-bisphosphate phosphatase
MSSLITKPKLERVVFLDRDGVINEDSPDYIKSWSEFFFLPKSIQAIKNLTENGFAIILITNQSIIGRKMVSLATLEHTHKMLCRSIHDKGGEITDIFFCPHDPADQCDCRKPKTGLFQQAQSKYLVDMPETFMVGDSAKDIEGARKAGCGHTILVQTGNGPNAKNELAAKGIVPDYIAIDLYQASEWILSR